jgi:ATP-dependent RNA helicase DDX56/DBP9
MTVDKLTNLVLDEADLVLSYGYDEDLENISRAIPKGVQAIMMSATLTAEVDTLKALFCRNPKVLNLEEKDAEGEGVKQFIVKTAEDEKFLLAYVIFKLQLVKGKCIIFVADVDRCYRLRLFFEQFGIRSTILNSELPVNSRIHVVEEFNRNVYDILIASDENEVIGDEEDPDANKATEEEKVEATAESEEGETEQKRPKKKRKTVKRDKEYGVSRGIDFQNVACVINFDLPTSTKSYTHRIGRTARAGQTGMALSFYVPSDLYRKHVPTSVETAANDEKVLARIVKQQNKQGKEVKPYIFDMNQVEPFRYRMNDALRYVFEPGPKLHVILLTHIHSAVTKVAIREARTRELRQELLKSEKLKRHFEENPAELHHLRHDGELRAARTQAHLKHIPDYLLPKEGKEAITSHHMGFVPLVNKDKKVRGKKFKGKFNRPGGFKVGGRKGDPLKSFKARRKTK